MSGGTRNATGDVPVSADSGDNLTVTPLQPVGEIRAAVGSVTVTRASGVVVQVKAGTPVYQGDAIETDAEGTVHLAFEDGTAFNLSASARMVLDEFVRDSRGITSSALLRLVRGAFTFIVGRLAKGGSLDIDTPVARIRGSAQAQGFGIATLAALTFSLVEK